jgi:pSer/pThr/pTyr-binding forkhead associated (FHA) protein
MPYGRLDVFWPDGSLKSYTLEDPSISVGGADDNEIALGTDRVALYHFRILIRADGGAVMDLGSAFGTYIDGVRLTPNVEVPLSGVDELQIGPLRMVIYLTDESPTIPIELLESDTQRYAQEAVPFAVDVDREALDVWPASSNSVELAVHNKSEATITVVVSAAGLPERWLRVNRPTLTIQAHETSFVLLDVKPNRHPQTTPGVYTVTILVRLENDPSASLELPLLVTIHPFRGIGIALGAAQLGPGDRLRLFLHNQGSAPLELRLTAVSLAAGLALDLPEHASLAAGQRTQIQGQVTARRPLTGALTQAGFRVEVRGLGAAGFVAALSGQVEIRPRLGRWRLTAAAGLLVAAIAFALLVLASLAHPAPAPAIVSLVIEPAAIAQGQPVRLDWVVTDAESLQVLVDGRPVVELPPSTTSYTMQTADLLGDVQVALRARAGDQVAEAVQALAVVEPLQVQRFDVEPRQMVLNVLTEMAIDWEVTGASRVRLDGLHQFTTTQPQFEVLPQGSLAFTDFPGTRFAVSLYAEDVFGVPIATRPVIEIDVVPARCLATSDLSFHEGPDLRYQVIGSANAGDSIVVNGQVGNGTWLQSVLAGERPGWVLAAQFQCDPQFDPAKLETVADFPALILSATPTPTATGTPPPAPATSAPATPATAIASETPAG